MKRFLLVAIGLVVVGVVVAALLLPAFVDVDAYRPEIEETLESATGRQVTLGELGLRLLPRPTLAASGLSIGEDPRFGTGPFLDAKKLEVSVALLPLLRGKVAVGSLKILSPDLHLLRDPDRGWNLASLMSGPPGAGPRDRRDPASGAGGDLSVASAEGGGTQRTGTSAAVSLSIDRLSLTGGTITLVDKALTRGETLTSQARKIDLEVTDLSLESSIGIDLSFELPDSGAARLKGRIGPIPAPGSEAPLPMDARLRLDGFRGGAAAPYLRAFSGLGIHGGSLDLDLSVSGEIPGDLEARGEATLNDLSVDPLSGGGPPVEIDGSVALEGLFSEEGMRLSRCDISTGRSAVSLAGTLSGLRSRPVIDARVETERVAFQDVLPVLKILGSFLPPGLTGEGEIALAASVKGPLREPGKMAIEGRASIAGFAFADASLRKPITGIEGTLTLEGDRAKISGFTASLGRSRVHGECSISRFQRPIVDVQLTSPLIDLDEILKLLRTATPLETAAAGRGESRGGDREPEPGAWTHAVSRSPAQDAGGVIPAVLDASSMAQAATLLGDVTIRGGLAVDRMKVVNLDLSAVRGALSMENGLARLSNLALTLYQGSLTGEVSAGLAETGPPFTLSASLEGVDFNAMAADYSPEMAGLLHGTLGAGLDLRGKGLSRPDLRRHLKGTGRIALRDGRLTSFGMLKLIAQALEAAGGRGIGEDETPFKALTGTFDVNNGRARTEDLKLNSPDIKLTGKGDVTLDLGLDLGVSVRISEEVSAGMVAKTPNLSYLQNKNSKIVLDLELGGTLLEPSVRLDSETLKRAARTAAEEQVREKGKDLVDKLLKKKKKKD